MNTGIPAIDNARATPIIGSDEVGFGAWAGELVTCAVAAPCDWDPHDPLVKDSKQLTPAQRTQVYRKWWAIGADGSQSLVISLGIIEVGELNAHPIHDCLKRAHRNAIEGTFWRLPCNPIIVVDGIVNPYDDPATTHLAPPYPDWIKQVHCLPKADALVPAVALASVIAKVTRDRMMVEWDKKYPGYGFASHKGYGTPQHQEGLAKLGPCPIHRMQYAPIARAMREMQSPERALFESLCDED